MESSHDVARFPGEQFKRCLNCLDKITDTKHSLCSHFSKSASGKILFTELKKRWIEYRKQKQHM